MKQFKKVGCLIALLSLVGLWFFFLRNCFDSKNAFAIFQDNEFCFGPFFSSASRIFSHYEWPLWTNDILGGFPLYNFVQFSAFYPFYFTFLPIFKTPLDAMHSMYCIGLLHLFIFEVNTYIFLRVNKISIISSLIGAVLVTFSPDTLTYSNVDVIIAPHAWLPLYLAGLVGILQYSKSIKFFLLALIGMVFLVQAAPAQTLIHAVALTAVFLAFWLVDQLRSQKDKEEILKVLFKITMLSICSFLLTAPIIIPAVFELKNMLRFIDNFPPVTGNNLLPFKAFLESQMSIKDLVEVFFYQKNNFPIGNPYLGCLAVTLLLMAVLKKPLSWIRKALFFVAGYSLLSAMGDNGGLLYINFILPLINKIREATYFLVIFQLSSCALVAFGMDDIIFLDKKNRTYGKIIGLLLIPLTSFILFYYNSNKLEAPKISLITIGVLMALSFITWGLDNNKFKLKVLSRVWGSAMILTLSFTTPWMPRNFLTSNYIKEKISDLDSVIKRIVELDPNHEYRVIFGGTINKQHAAMTASYHGIRTLNVYTTPVPKKQFDELYYHGPRENNYFRALGAKYLIVKDYNAKEIKGYNYLETDSNYDIYVVEDALPHSYVCFQVAGFFKNLNDFQEKVNCTNLASHPLFISVFDQRIQSYLSNNTLTSNKCTLDNTIHNFNHLQYKISSEQPSGVLVINEFFDFPWCCYVDGMPQEILKVNGNQLGIFFKKGSHTIDLYYRPKLFIFSLYLMLLGFLLLAAYLASGYYRKALL